MRTRNRCGRTAIWAVVGLLDLAMVQASEVLYVDARTDLPGTGQSWATACVDLQDALDRASYGDEIRMAQGIYLPT